MEAVGLAASLISIADLSRSISFKTLLLHTSPNVSSSDMLEYQIYCEILIQVGGQSLSIPGKLPDAVQTGLTLCHERITQVENFLSSPTRNMIRSIIGRFRHQEAKSAIRDFGRSVKILRDIVMEYAAIHT